MTWCSPSMKQIRAKIEDHKESHDPEPLELTVSDVGCILANSGVDTERVEAFKANCEKQYGENAQLNPVNIIESRKFQVTTPEVKISIAPENSYLIETRIIDGRKYLLIPADDGVESQQHRREHRRRSSRRNKRKALSYSGKSPAGSQ
ncbi:MAG: DUF4317 family protein [Dysosmobacter sp.]